MIENPLKSSGPGRHAPPIYCIGLAASTGRRERMQRRLAYHGLTERAQFVAAVPAPAAGSDSQEHKDRAGSACFASHLQAMRRALADPAMADHGALICEDDVLFHNGFPARLAATLENLPAGTTLCSLGYMIGRWESDFRWAGRAPGQHNLCRWVPGALWSSHLYWISARYATEVVERYGSTPIAKLPSATERILDESGGLASFPSLGIQDVIDSAIRPAEELDFHLTGQAPWSYADYAECEQGEDISPLRDREPRSDPTIALCMIVRDESAVIGRCLESARPLIDRWVICDTGSRDGTPEIVSRLLADLPGELHERPWRDFGQNRSELMALAANAADYLLLLDADMTLDWAGPLPPLDANAYLLRHDGDVTYAIPRLVSGRRAWHFEGSTHEYLAGDGPHRQVLLEALVIQHHADGGARATKFQRDAMLLERDLARAPDDVRATFYLAQTYRDLGETRRAIDLYQRRAALGGWEEEVFYSTYQAGVLLAGEDDDAAIATLLTAWQQRPQRAEPLYELVHLLRYRRLYQPAYVLARHGVQLDCPPDLLFVHRWIYEWGLSFELAIAAYWVGDIDLALEHNDRLLAAGHLPPEIDAAVRENRHYCTTHPTHDTPQPSEKRSTGGSRVDVDRRAPLLEQLCPSVDRRALDLDIPAPWSCFNPTIAADDEGFRLIVRTANYRIIGGRYEFSTEEPVVRTINYLVRLDEALQIVASAPLVPAAQAPATYAARVQGFEDCRLLRVGRDWVATATVRDHNPVERAEMALLTLNEETIDQITLLKGPSPLRHEKNWMPFSVDGGLFVLYSCDPTIVLGVDRSTGAPRTVASAPGPAGADRFRGGSQGIWLSEGRLFVVHEVDEAAGRRVYHHRFVRLDADHTITGISPVFQLVGDDIEFCAGLARRGDQLLLTFGVGDRTAVLVVVSADEVLGTIRPVDR
jgi:tetratricopeptide (TPR) repeat protein/predicted GH43/DUF377 family glycosyl hydrolase